MDGITSIPSALQIATGSIRQSLKNLANDASVVANSNAVESRDTIATLVDSRQQLIYTRMAVKIIQTSDEMTKSLLDVHA
jgi:adenylate kinase